MENVTVIKLEKQNSYALTTPGKIVFLENCNETSLNEEVEKLSNEHIVKKMILIIKWYLWQ